MRTERPELPTRPTDLTRTERLAPLSARESGEDVRIDRRVLAELYDRLADAVGAVERGNNRITGNNRYWDCITAVWTTGKPSAACSTSR